MNKTVMYHTLPTYVPRSARLLLARFGFSVKTHLEPIVPRPREPPRQSVPEQERKQGSHLYNYLVGQRTQHRLGSNQLCINNCSFSPQTMSPRNLTGFDMKEFKAAASPSSAWAKKDPWARKYVRSNVLDVGFLFA